jgi:hypothetical protein
MGDDRNKMQDYAPVWFSTPFANRIRGLLYVG